MAFKLREDFKWTIFIKLSYGEFTKHFQWGLSEFERGYFKNKK